MVTPLWMHAHVYIIYRSINQLNLHSHLVSIDVNNTMLSSSEVKASEEKRHPYHKFNPANNNHHA